MPSADASFDHALAQLGRRAWTSMDHASVLADAAQMVRGHLAVDLCSVIQLLPDGRGLFLAGAGWPPGLVGSTTLELEGESAAGHCLRALTPVAIADIRSDQRFSISTLLHDQEVAGSLLVPLYGPLRPQGVLGAHTRRPRAFSEDETARLQTIANIVAGIVIARERDQQQHSQKLLRAEQMMAIGQVAAGVAHELRNPLTSIKGLIQVNIRDLTSRGLPAQDLTIIEHEIRRMERTLQTFLDFARPPTPHRRSVDLSEVAEKVLALVAGRARKQAVQLQLIKPQTQVLANVDFDQIQQLLLNLVLNALDALPRGGQLEVELQLPRDGFAEVYVRDNGPGIASEILPKVFETFVSSKATGVGLGLPLSRRIAEEHGGTLTAYNLPESGACFLLRLPAP